jgi:hypothetical protein
MHISEAKLLDQAVVKARALRDEFEDLRMVGHGYYQLWDERGRLKQANSFANLITQVGDQYYGDRAANIRTGASATITAVTNVASPVFTATAHGLGVGDVVTISGATPAGYNGSWVVTAVTANSFTVYVGTALGAGSAFNWSFVGNTVPMVTGMRLGTGGATAATKTGAGAAIVTYTTASQVAINGSFPTSSIPGSARRIQWKTTWGAGVATANGISEWVITTEQPLSNVAGTAANTISRAVDVAGAVNKGASDTLDITWNHDLLGA